LDDVVVVVEHNAINPGCHMVLVRIKHSAYQVFVAPLQSRLVTFPVRIIMDGVLKLEIGPGPGPGPRPLNMRFCLIILHFAAVGQYIPYTIYHKHRHDMALRDTGS
jgi:hypothetical protein